MIDFNLIEKNLIVFENLNYSLNTEVNYEEFIEHYRTYLSLFDGLPVEFSKENENQLSVIYLILGQRLNRYRYISNNCFFWDLEFFDIDGKIEYIEFMKRMGTISRKQINFENIKCNKIDNGLDDKAKIEFEVNGEKKMFTIEYGCTEKFILFFSNLCYELKVNGNYTIYESSGQSFVLDFAISEKELTNFNNITGLKRKWLKDWNI